MKRDWTKLDNGWVRRSSQTLSGYTLSSIYKYGVNVYDDGEIWATEDTTPERMLEILTEAVAQRRQCEVHGSTEGEE